VSPRALITGVAGQDGNILARRLTELEYEVIGTVQPETDHTDIDDICGLSVVEVELRSENACRRIVYDTEPDLVFHFAGISSVAYSWSHPIETAAVNGQSVVAIIDSLLDLQNSTGKERILVNASSAEIFAGTASSPQNENTAIAPLSPYGATKAFSHHIVQMYRARGLRASNAIFYNHESPLRPQHFVTRKITAAAAAIAHGHQSSLEMGNLDARRDWGWAPDYVDAALRMAGHETGGDFVIATGEAHSVREFVAAAFHAAGIEDWHSFVTTSEAFGRPAESAEMVGDASKARAELEWEPTKRFADVVGAMVEHDLTLAEGRSR
jgi:GDPmannose 4,6-dehydratase